MSGKGSRAVSGRGVKRGLIPGSSSLDTALGTSQIIWDFAYLVECGWRQIGPMARREIQMWTHSMLPGSHDGYITGEAMRVQKRFEAEDRVTKSLGGKLVPCCGARYTGPTFDENLPAFDFATRKRDYLVCELQVGHTGDHIASSVGFEKQEWDEWRWDGPALRDRRPVVVTGKELRMASAYDAPQAGEWVQPKRRGYKLACCDCGLVHTLNFRLVKYGPNLRKIQFQVFRNNRSTGQIRRWMKKGVTDA